MYYIVYGIFYLISLLPWRIMYIISDGIAFLLYYVIRYRRSVVEGNLAIAFPGKTTDQRKKIAREFYKNFVDNFIEVIKFLSISKEDTLKRFTSNYHEFPELAATTQNIQFALGHFFNWEWANLSCSLQFNFPLIVVYMPIENKAVNKIFKKIRSRFGSHLVAATNFKKEFIPYASKKHGLVLVADQNPGGDDRGYWVNFCGRKTAFIKGPERNAVMNNQIVMFVNFYKVKRGYYHSEFSMFTKEPRSLPPGFITREVAAFIERSIHRHPSNYLWSHRRWKWQYDENRHKHLLVE